MPDHLLQPRKEDKEKKNPNKTVPHCSLHQASNPTVITLNSHLTSSQPVPIFSSGLPPTRMQKLFEVVSAGNAKAPKATGEINKNIRCLSVSHTVVSNSATPWTVARQAPLSMGFLQARILEWVGIPFPGDLLKPGIKPGSPALQADSLPLSYRVQNTLRYLKR